VNWFDVEDEVTALAAEIVGAQGYLSVLDSDLTNCEPSRSLSTAAVDDARNAHTRLDSVCRRLHSLRQNAATMSNRTCEDDVMTLCDDMGVEGVLDVVAEYIRQQAAKNPFTAEGVKAAESTLTAAEALELASANYGLEVLRRIGG